MHFFLTNFYLLRPCSSSMPQCYWHCAFAWLVALHVWQSPIQLWSEASFIEFLWAQSVESTEWLHSPLRVWAMVEPCPSARLPAHSRVSSAFRQPERGECMGQLGGSWQYKIFLSAFTIRSISLIATIAVAILILFILVVIVVSLYRFLGRKSWKHRALCLEHQTFFFILSLGLRDSNLGYYIIWRNRQAERLIIMWWYAYCIRKCTTIQRYSKLLSFRKIHSKFPVKYISVHIANVTAIFKAPRDHFGRILPTWSSCLNVPLKIFPYVAAKSDWVPWPLAMAASVLLFLCAAPLLGTAPAAFPWYLDLLDIWFLSPRMVGKDILSGGSSIARLNV